MRNLLKVLSAGLVSVGLAVSYADDKPTTKPIVTNNTVVGNEINFAQKQSVNKALGWLASQQNEAGGYGDQAYSDNKEGHSGITALAALAFMQNGSLPNKGRYGSNVQKCLDFVLAHCEETGFISSPNGNGTMYEHGFATLFLGEVYGMTGDPTVKEHLEKAVHLIERSQNQQGGWRCQPFPNDADISVTICQVMALRSARDSGIKVQKSVLDKALKYIINCQNDDGGFCYQTEMHGSGSGYARTAAGVSILYYIGDNSDKEIKKGLGYLEKQIPGSKEESSEGMYFYANYYGVQAAFLTGGEFWKKFYPAIRDQLISKQDKDGSWSGEAGNQYATSMALIILQMPNKYLPIYNGKGQD